MLRLSMILCAVVFVTLLIAGEDKGQLRPHLAQAIAKGEKVEEIALFPEAAAFEPSDIIVKTDVDALPPVVQPKPRQRVTKEPLRSEEPQEKPIFTLASLPGTNSLGGDQVHLPEVADFAQDEALPSEESNLRYVAGNSVNVRMGPTTQSAVVTRLGRGEAVTVLSDADAGWVEIAIEGDGGTGYIAANLLSYQP